MLFFLFTLKAALRTADRYEWKRRIFTYEPSSEHGILPLFQYIGPLKRNLIISFQEGI